MAEVTRERQGDQVRAVFEVLMAHPDGLPGREVIAAVEERLKPTEFEQTDYESTPGRRRFDTQIRFATIGPVKAGWMVKNNGIWTVTDEGVAAYQTFTDPAAFTREASRLYRVWKKDQVDADDGGDDDEVIETAAATTLEEAEEAAWAGISDYLANMPPYDFQELVAGLLRAMGYHVPWVAPRGRDGGVDVIAFTDPIGASGPRIKVQVKRQTSSKIDVDGLRSFLAVLGQQDTGLFVSLGGFTTSAEAEARAQDNRRLLLVDMEQLVSMWIEHYPKLSETDRSRLPLRPVHFLAPSD